MAEVKNYLPVIVNNFIVRFENPVGLARPLWRDYSRYQGLVNADVAIANGVLGMAHRATISYGYQDPFFAINYNNFGREETYRTSYHVDYPDQPVVKQADNWYKAHEYIDIVPRVIDAELSHNVSPAKIGDHLWEFCELVYTRDGLYPILYSRKNLLDLWLANWTQEQLDKVWYWLAQYLFAGYLEHPGPPAYPNRVKEERVILHQTSDHKLAPAGEVASKSVDWDRWEIGTASEMHLWINDNWAGGAIPPQPPSAIIPIDHLRVTANALNMRTEPNGSALDIGTILQNSDISITQKEGVWGKVEGWIHTNYTEPYP